ncbi:MAG: hypothetical protein ACP5D7_22515 [Limnospira sp.]
MTKDWYEIVDADCELTQGDLIPGCPILTWKTELPQLNNLQSETEVLKASVEAIQADVIVMTQACDLENYKVENVILCPHFSLSEYKQGWEEVMSGKNQNPSAKAWRRHCDDIKDGYIWNLSMLNYFNSEILSVEHRVVEFHEVYTIPRYFLESLLQQRGESRLRLLPPYREHLSQAFARFFMRVGLPIGVDEKAWRDQ